MEDLLFAIEDYLNVDQPQPLEVVGAMLLSFALNLFIAFLYRSTYKGTRYSQDFVQTLIMIGTITTILIMVVLDKKREISVLKAMGASDGGILRIFLYQGGFIGGLGTGLGLLLGFVNCQILRTWAFPLDPKVYFISQLPVLMRWQEFAITGAISVALCLLATIIPSLYAANIRPADGFRDQGCNLGGRGAAVPCGDAPLGRICRVQHSGVFLVPNLWVTYPDVTGFAANDPPEATKATSASSIMGRLTPAKRAWQ